METRQRKIDDDLARAERLRNEAAAVLAEHEKTMAQARAEAGRLMKEASDAAAKEQAQRIAAFNAELALRTGEAEGRIADAVAQAESNLRSIAADAAQQVTARLLGRDVPRDEIEAALAAAASRRA